MVTEVRYLDVIWFDNLIMNFVLLWITLKLSKNRSPLWRLWLAAGAGALYAVCIFLPGFELLQRLPIKIALSLTMLLIAFQIRNFKELFKLLLYFYGMTFAFGGAALGLYYLTGENMEISSGVFVLKNFPVKTLILATVLGILLIRAIWISVRKFLYHDSLLCDLMIEIDGKSVDVEALLDTGNALWDPISHCPVIVVEYEKFKELLPNDINSIFAEYKENNLEFIIQAIANSSWVSRFRMIPFTALGKPNGMLIGFKPDKVKIRRDEEWLELEENIIGVYNNKLSKDSHYHALMHPAIIR